MSRRNTLIGIFVALLCLVTLKSLAPRIVEQESKMKRDTNCPLEQFLVSEQDGVFKCALDMFEGSGDVRIPYISHHIFPNESGIDLVSYAKINSAEAKLQVYSYESELAGHVEVVTYNTVTSDISESVHIKQNGGYITEYRNYMTDKCNEECKLKQNSIFEDSTERYP